MSEDQPKQSAGVAVVGSGPAALMAAEVISGQGHRVVIFEKRQGPARKLFIAGGSGLNISSSVPLPEFASHYSGPKALWTRLLKQFSPADWLAFIEGLGVKTFEGTSRRYFAATMNAALLIRSWRRHLTQKNVTWKFNHECTDFKRDEAAGKWRLSFRDQESVCFDAVCFCLGGGSYEPDESPLRWPGMFRDKGLTFTAFSPSNVGHQVAWSEAFLKEADGLPLKNIRLTSSRGSRLGDAVITAYGMEGTPVYFVGEVGKVSLDLKPDLDLEQIRRRCLSTQENLSPMRRVKRQLKLCAAAQALLFHELPDSVKGDLQLLTAKIKEFPIEFRATQSLAESISSAGGLGLDEIDDTMMLRRFPGVFAAGEMLDWDAPTGGFLIQGCVSQGAAAGRGICRFLSRRK